MQKNPNNPDPQKASEKKSATKPSPAGKAASDLKTAAAGLAAASKAAASKTPPPEAPKPRNTEAPKLRNTETPAPTPMRTMLSKFASEFCAEVEPVRGPLANLEALISALPTGHPLQSVLPELRDQRHHVDALLEKVRQQHAYVLIFGPLKSGKSTLMNAICASYVSEVTSLPAYPALVHISYSEEPVFKATRYDGTTRSFDNREALHEAIQKAHMELTRRLREIEDKGESFDPVVHMPTAFRKIDVGLATPELAVSRAVLVDTPGLYSRMKFGYDQMTRDFRNTAACAIFVVKSDNLFLEQVFEEFQELLELFSRIFLIVNLDTRKKDLDAKGELVPSLESKDPGKIIDAFRNLAMSAPLKAAADDGRLRIYPVDLLDAASERIRTGLPKARQTPPELPAPATEVELPDSLTEEAKPFVITKPEDAKLPKSPPADPKPFEIEPSEAPPPAAKSADSKAFERKSSAPPKTPESAPPKPAGEKPVSGFETLRRDLVEYLNSNDYLKAFLADSVRRASSLMSSVQNTLRNRSFADVKTEIAELTRQKDALAREHRTIAESQSLDLRAASAPLSTTLRKEAESWHEELRQSAEKAFAKILDDWWQGDASLADLREKSLAPYLRRVAEHFVGRIGVAMESKTAGPSAGLEIEPPLAENLRALGLDLAATATRIAKEVSPKPDAIPGASNLSADQIPVKRRFLDWILFRGARRRRLDVFGPEDDPSRPIPAAVKEKRLGENARNAILEQCLEDFEAIWSKETLELPAQTVTAYADSLADWLTSTLDRLAARNRDSTARIEKSLADYQALHNEASHVFDTVTKTAEAIRKSHPFPFQPESAPGKPARTPAQAPKPQALKPEAPKPQASGQPVASRTDGPRWD